MPAELELSGLDPKSFEQLVNMLVIRVLGAGSTGFGPGPDGGRDGYFRGTANYPSQAEQWSGHWFIQSKFHKPHLSKDPQKWLVAEVKKEIRSFRDGARNWPDNWIIATNIDASGASETGAFDQINKKVREANPALDGHLHVWGGRKILDLLALNEEVSDYYRHFLTPGHILTALYSALEDQSASINEIARFLIVDQFDAHRFTKLDQAGSAADTRPGVHELFVDLPFKVDASGYNNLIINDMLRSSAKCHAASMLDRRSDWRIWHTHPPRARVFFILGGPGNGKSTTAQYFCQLQRAALIADWDGPIHPKFLERAEEIKASADGQGHWPLSPRIPISIELREYAYWFGTRKNGDARGILTYLASKIGASVDAAVSPKTLKRAISAGRWFIGFDGLDEVPNDVKEPLAEEIIRFIDDTSVECNGDILFLCTSRPQGYSGQFDELEAVTCSLSELEIDKALECAEPVIRIGRSNDEASKGMQILRSAASSPSVRSLMTTPLQAHIMAVVVRDGKRPPERRWQLFENFYQVIKRREANRDLPDAGLARLLREEDQLLKTVHNRLGFLLHARAETSKGAQTSISREEFQVVLRKVVEDMKDGQIAETVAVLNEATATRLVLVNTPDDGDSLRFDIRPLQEFFAAEFLHDTVEVDQLRERIAVLLSDAHWREVMHHLLSALVEGRRITEIAQAVQLLEEIDRSGEFSQEREVSRRLAVAALLTARLAQDGVLEQDKRIRRMFTGVIQRLLGSTDARDVSFLGAIRHIETRAWLVDLCFAQMREAAPSESVGAGMLLWTLLRDSDSLAKDYVELLESKPLDYQGVVLRILPEQRWHSENQPGDSPTSWQASYLYRILTRSDWHKLSESTLERAVSVLSFSVRRKNPARITFIKGRAKIDSLLVRFLDRDRSSRILDREKTPAEKLGIVNVYARSTGWHTGATHVKGLDSLESLKRPGPAGGLFSVAEAIAAYCGARDVKSYNRLVDQLKTLPPTKARWLLKWMDTYLPFSKENLANPKKLTRVSSEDALSKALRFINPPALIYIEDEADITADDWGKLIEKLPSLANRMLFLSFYYRSEATINKLRDQEFVNIFIDAFLMNPQLLEPSTFLGWGMLLEASPEREPEIRKTLVRAFGNTSMAALRSEEPQSNIIAPLELDLEEELPLVPLLVDAVIGMYHELPRAHEGRTGSRPSRREETQQLVKQYIPEIPSHFRDGVRNMVDSRCSGYLTLLLLIHPDGGLNTDVAFDRLIAIYTKELDEHFLYLVLSYVSLYFPLPEAAVRKLVGGLLYSAHANLDHRVLFHGLISQWRESSFAPARRADAIEKWL